DVMTNPTNLQPEAPVLFPYTRKLLRFIGRKVEGILAVIGTSVQNSDLSFRFLMRGGLKQSEWMNQSAFIGIKTLGIAMLLTVFVEMVTAMQLSKEMAHQGAGGYMGAMMSLALIRELAPIMTAVAVVAMAGSAFAAELSTMQITRQVDALTVMHVSPVRYLIL